MADESEQNTLQDLFRVMNDMRTEIREGFAKVDAQHDEVKGELQAIRQVVDNELASQEQVNALEAHVRDFQRTLRQQHKRITALEG